MSNPLNPTTIHPELGPVPSGERVVSSGATAVGAIIFNNPATQPSSGANTIQDAIAEGDTLQARQEAFFNCYPGQK